MWREGTDRKEPQVIHLARPGSGQVSAQVWFNQWKFSGGDVKSRLRGGGGAEKLHNGQEPRNKRCHEL